MRLITWNVNLRTRAKAIPRELPKIIASLDPDLVVFTEYVHGASRQSFLAQLAGLGLPYWLVSRATPKGENHVLVASRTPIVAGAIEAPAIAPSVPTAPQRSPVFRREALPSWWAGLRSVLWLGNGRPRRFVGRGRAAVHRVGHRPERRSVGAAKNRRGFEGAIIRGIHSQRRS
jgi:hypothetical protein